MKQVLFWRASLHITNIGQYSQYLGNIFTNDVSIYTPLLFPLFGWSKRIILLLSIDQVVSHVDVDNSLRRSDLNYFKIF